MINTETLSSYPDVLTAKQLQKILQISRASTYNLLNRADFPTLHVMGRKLVSKANLLEWMEANTGNT